MNKKNYFEIAKIAVKIGFVISGLGVLFAIYFRNIVTFSVFIVFIVYLISFYEFLGILRQLKAKQFNLPIKSVNPKGTILVTHMYTVIIAFFIILYSIGGLIFNFFGLPNINSSPLTGELAFLCNFILLLAGLQWLVAIYLYHTRKRKLEKEAKK